MGAAAFLTFDKSLVKFPSSPFNVSHTKASNGLDPLFITKSIHTPVFLYILTAVWLSPLLYKA